MKKRWLHTCPAILLAAVLAYADDPLPTAITGTFRTGTQEVAGVMGRRGALFITSETRWQDLQQLFAKLKILPVSPIPKIDFKTQGVVLLYTHSADILDAYTVTKTDLAEMPWKLELLLNVDQSEHSAWPVPSPRFILAIINYPKTLPAPSDPSSNPSVRIALTSQVVDSHRALDRNFTAVLGGADTGGDIVDRLQARITPKNAKIKVGDDILIDIELHLADVGKGTWFPDAGKSVSVWDGVYSNGYYNHSFIVTDPKGKTTVLRPAVIEEWGENSPHPVAITATQPYHLPGRGENATYKSLKTLGLDTSTPGTYSITAVYEETSRDGKMWAGSIASNLLHIQVDQ